MRFTEITESINDKGIFKAVFLAGSPGAGKSTVSQKVADGTVSPRLVNIDRSYEFLLKKHGAEANHAAWALLGEKSKAISSSLLTNYINGMLPMFVDGTSANPSSALRRSGIIESLGYDTAMIWVGVSLETALERVEGRERKVDTDFIKQVHETLNENKELYRSRFGANFIEVDNNADNFSAMESKVYATTSNFFSSPVSNPIGQRLINQMKKSGDKYLVPNVHSKEYIEKIVSVWYT